MTNQSTVQNATRGSVTAVADDLNTILQQALENLETTMHDVVDSDVTVLRDASRHILEAGGKRVRPRLMFLAYLAAGGHDVHLTVPLAASVELMHTASIVHDDINDHGVVRRGRPSVNALYGRTFALLTGDYFFTKVYELMAPYNHLNVELADAAVALVEGETLQASAVKENRLTREVYNDIIGRKTAALFRAAGRMGALLADAPTAYVDALGSFAYQVGLAFQIVDDVLDLTASPEKIGKTSGIDLLQGKGFAAAYEGDAETAGSSTDDADPMDKIKAKILGGNAINEARMLARALVESAINEIALLPESEVKDALIDVANMVVDREF